jgi:alkylated DNA repair dioxygenase AlkB
MGSAVREQVHAALHESVSGLQLNLAAGPPQPDRAFASARRVALDQASWIDFVPGWLSGQEALFEQVARQAEWEHRERRMFNQVFREPRFTGEYRELADAPLDSLREIAEALSDRYGTVYDGVWMNFYRDHRDGAGWHADRPADKPAVAIVPVLSLGAQRRFLIKPVAGGRSTVFTPRGGDLIVMGGRAQRDWRHAAPKQTRPAGPRISLNFTSRAQVDAQPDRGGSR